MTLPAQSITTKTVALERLRAVLSGIYESAPNMFVLLIVVRWFHGSPLDKSIIPAAGAIGFLVAPLVIFIERRTRASVSRAISVLYWISAAALAAAGAVASKDIFICLCVLAIVMHSAVTPLLTSVYSNNIPPTVRGRYFAQFTGIKIGTSIVFATLAGWAISGRLDRYPVLFAFFALSVAGSAWLTSRIPATATHTETRPLLSCFAYLKTDVVLRETSIAWMLLGFGNLMMIPLRVEYLANERYGLNLSEAGIAILVSTVPNIARLIGSLIWGRLFDSMNFFSLRITLNLSFLVGTLAFFGSSSWTALIMSAVVLGFTTAGGEVAWNLWVTKFAPAGRVQDYMAVHTFLTGIRSLVAPAVGFYLLQFVSIHTLSWIASGMMLLSVLVLWSTRGEFIGGNHHNHKNDAAH